MASSSSSPRTWKYDVFPSFSGEDVRKSFLSHLLEKLQRKLIITFIDNGIERSRLIAPELLLAIRESKNSIVVFSKKYVSSTWCLNELAEIHECYKEMNQMVIPVFYNLDPSDVRKQTGEFGKSFDETCKGKTEDVKQRWIRALAEVASIAGYDFRNWSDEPKMIEQISIDVSDKLFTPSDDFHDLVGIGAHVEAIMDSKLCLESEEVRMVGIVGPSGIGKTTIARALFSRLSSHFQHRAFVTSKRASMQDKKDAYIMKLGWANQLLSEILGQKDIKIESLGMVEQRLKHWKLLIVLDDVDEIELLKTLVGCTGWFGFGSRIVVVTQDRALLKSHEIDLIYEVELPSDDLARQMFCQSAFGQIFPPDVFLELAAEATELAGNLPLGLNALGSSLRGKPIEEWVEMMPRLRNGLNGKIGKTLRLCYNGLDEQDDQDIFLYIACLFSGESVNHIKNMLPDSVYRSVSTSLKTLADKSLVSIIDPHHVQMHILLQKLGREIVREESILNPGERRFLVDANDIYDVFEDNTGTNNVLGIYWNTSEIDEPLSINEKSFQRMRNLQFLKFYKDQGAQKSGEVRLNLPRGLIYLPRKLRLLHWDECPLKCMPSNFKAEYLVELSMRNSKLDKLWEGTQQLRSLKRMNIGGSTNLKEIPDLSFAINLEKMDLFECASLVTLPSSIGKLKKLITLRMTRCSNLEVLPANVNLESLSELDLRECSRLRSFPRISKNISQLGLSGNAIEEEDFSWIENNMSRVTTLFWFSCPLRCLPSNFCPESLTHLVMRNSKFEKLWEGVQPIGKVVTMDLSGSENLKEFPNLSKAHNLMYLCLNDCKSLVTVPCTIRILIKLWALSMRGCTGLESFPTDLNLKSLYVLNLSGCSQLKSFPRITRSIEQLSLNDTAIEEVPYWIKYFLKLMKLEMRGCKRLKTISSNIFELEKLKWVDFSDCEGVTEFGDVESLKDTSHSFYHRRNRRLNFRNCFSLDQSAQKLVIYSDFKYAVLPGEQVPKYFTHRARGSSVTIHVPKSSLLEEILVFKVCIVLEPLTVKGFDLPCVGVCWYFRGKTGVCRFHFHSASVKMDHHKMDHLLVFHFRFPTEEVTELPPESDYDKVKFEFDYRLYGCSHKLHERTCDTEACPYMVQRIKGCGMQMHISPSQDGSCDETIEVYRDPSSSSEDEAEVINIFGSYMEAFDYKSLSSSDEEEDSEGHLSDDEEMIFSSSVDEEEDTGDHEDEASDNLPVHSTITSEDITQWIYDSTYYC